MANQGFNVEVGQDGGQPATVTIFGLREVDDRTQAVDPSNVSGNISVLLDVQYNDETVTNVDLTLGDEVISCRGASSDAASPTGVVPGLAESGGSVEIECFFDTDQVAGECTGMQMAPRFANGQHELGAQITTDDGSVRQALASQMITLKNSNYVMIDHNPGSVSNIVGGVTFYGGPTTEDNVNTFDVCPVAFDGTMVGKIGLRGMTDTMQEEGDRYNDDLSFRTHRSGRYGEYNGVRRVDDEAPFTFTVLSSQNALTEDRNAEGHGGHWIIQDGVISDPDGLDISDKFVPGDMANDLTKIGPIYFDFASPRVSGDSEITIEGKSIANVHYSGKRGTYDGRSQRFGVSGVTERGAGGVSDVIAVGDCSVGANTDTGERGAGTAFQAIVEDAAAVGDLPEDDKDGDELSDDGGVQCYTAELQSLVDRMGNSRSLSRVRIQSAANFGVDKTAPAIEDLQPDEELVLMEGAMLTFEVEDPELETGEDGSGLANTASTPDVYWGPSTVFRNRYYYSHDDPDGPPAGLIDLTNGVVTVATNTGNADADKDRKYVVVAEVRDQAVPPNAASAVFTYTRDSKGPGVTLSKSQSDIGSINTSTVTVSVGGKISDSNVIKRAELSIREVADGSTCMASADLAHGTGNPVVRNKRDLENNTNEIVFDESFTLRQAEGTKMYCFWLASADVAVEANGRGTGNPGDYELGSFSVAWPAGPPPAPPGPTFEFQTRTDDADPATATAAEDLSVGEGATTGNVYHVTLKDAPSGATYPLTMTVDAPATVTVAETAGGALEFASANDTVSLQVTNAHDLNITSEVHSLTHKATGFDDTAFPVTVMDDDFAITTDVASIREDDAAAEVTVTVTAGTADTASAGRTVTVALGYPSGDAATGAATTMDVLIPADSTSGKAMVMVDAADDGVQDEQNESIALTVSGSTVQGVHYAPAMIAIMDDDPDIQLSLSQSSAAEGDGAVTLTITATAKSAVSGIVTASVAIAGEDGAVANTDFTATTPVELTIDGGGTVGTATTTVTILDDSDDDDGETIEFSAVNVTVGGKDYTFGSVKLTIVDNDDT
ncbi:hypothetical protein [Candidatus Palauibacter sp.]|uniref:hypothetical protein n=1 Tax=Candidatus Palauibacter sp. TaxID=3101350 RepID=UPI003B5BACC1